MKWKSGFSFCAAALLGGLILPSFSRVLAQDAAAGPSSIVTVEPKNGNEAAEPVPASAVKVKIDGKDAAVAGWTPYGANATQPNLQLMLLIDDSARSSLGLHIQELQKFIKGQPATTETAVAYMRNGTAQFAGQFTTDHDKTAQTLRLPIAAAGSNGSPYFALSDLIKKWPAHNADERREVIMITDGIDRYNGLRYDPSNPYIDATIRDVIRNRVIVYAIYYHSAGFADRTMEGVNSGQNYLTQLCDTAGGYFFYQGLGNPVDFGPFLQQINRKLANQYELRVTAPEKKQGIVNLKVQVSAPNTRTKAPDKIFLGQ